MCALPYPCAERRWREGEQRPVRPGPARRGPGMFKNTFQSGFLSVLYSIGSKPLQIWDKKVRTRRRRGAGAGAGPGEAARPLASASPGQVRGRRPAVWGPGSPGAALGRPPVPGYRESPRGFGLVFFWGGGRSVFSAFGEQQAPPAERTGSV